MFLKLVKHEAHAAARAMLTLVCGLLAMAVLARGSIWMMEAVDTSVTNIIGVFLVGIFYLGCFAMVVTTMILMMVRFSKSVHGDEGYLTHTLPVGVHSILLSRLLICFLAVLVSFAAVYAGIQIATLGVDSVETLGVSLKSALNAAGVDTSAMLLKIFLMGGLSILSMILMLYAAISIGHSFANGKTGKSVLFFFILYFAQQVISSIVMVAVLAAEYKSTGSTNGIMATTDTGLTSTMFWFSVGQAAFFGGVYYFLTWITTKKRLNLA